VRVREKKRERGEKERYGGGEIFFARSGSPVAASAATATTPTASPSSSFASSSAPNLTAEEVAPSFRAFSIRIQTGRLRMR
jgi:hypothetical protein